jgi:hypothetical protein
MTTIRFAAPVYPGGRMCLLSGSATVGAVFPPAGTPHDRLPWVWRVWVTPDTSAREGRAKTEQAAKNAALAAYRDFIRAAGLQEVQP